uniref:Uncharacterized protein n=1 Tax=Medicago truncatula TaxID=3880 RepID=I3SJ31_MEDTR|nr:unknown [Medicago truncatula]
MFHRRSKRNPDITLLIINFNCFLSYHLEFFQRVRMLRILDISYMIKNLLLIDWFNCVFISRKRLSRTLLTLLPFVYDRVFVD